MSVELLTAWKTSLADIGELGVALRGAIERDDAVAAIATMCELRKSRSALARIEAPGKLAGSVAEAAAIGEAAALVTGARAAAATMQAWLSRGLPGDRALLSTPLGTAALADSMLPEVWDAEIDVVVLVGPGLAGVAQILTDLGQRRLIILGGDPMPDTSCVTVESLEELSAAMRMLVPNPPQQLALKASLSSDHDFVEQAAKLGREVLSDLRIHRNTVHAFSATWIEQGIANLPAIARCPSVATVGDAFAGKPMVIVAPGPSLATNAAQLRALAGKALITCFSHSLKPTLAAGVTPDFVVTVDPQDVRYHFAGCDISNSCLVNAATSHPSLFDLPARRFLTLSANCAIDDWLFDALGEDALVPGGGSVATSAFSLALRWHCDPIIFVGLDLSFPGGKYYVSTSSDGGAHAKVENGTMRVEGWSSDFSKMRNGAGAPTERLVELPGYHGGTVPSSFMFALYHRWFVERMKHVENTRVYNCTEGGAYIEGMEHRPLASVALDRRVDAARILDNIPIDRAERTSRLARHLGTYAQGMRQARLLASRARRLIQTGQTGTQLERIEQALTTALEPLQFVSLLAQREVDRATDIARRTSTAATYLAASDTLFRALDRAIDQLAPAISRARSNLETGAVPIRDVESPAR